jgi:phosphatidylinositol alpha-1,6-mannosyltransferase
MLVTNDYPPRVGGIQRTLEALAKELPADRVAVFCPAWDDTAAFDAAAPYRVLRQPERFLWPTREIALRIETAAREVGGEVVVFGATYPLAMMGPRLARRGLPYVAAAHGFEYWLSLAPGAHSLVRYATSGASRVAVMCSEFIARVVRTAVPDRVPVSVMYPGADTQAFRPDLPVEDLLERHGLIGRPVVVCVSRLVARKGQDMLIRAMPEIRRRVPEAALLIVGGGPYRGTLELMADTFAPRGGVVFAGQVSEEDLPRYYRAGDVFAMPCRNRLGGLEVEGWGNVFIRPRRADARSSSGLGGASRSSTGGRGSRRHEGRRGRGRGRLLEDPARRGMGRAGRERAGPLHVGGAGSLRCGSAGRPGAGDSTRDRERTALPKLQGARLRGRRVVRAVLLDAAADRAARARDPVRAQDPLRARGPIRAHRATRVDAEDRG